MFLESYYISKALWNTSGYAVIDEVLRIYGR
ncbi:hypothetical protein BD749_1000 [Pontibacter ramchanderi]|uniref:Uncharacterized protein n=1 Tax=Pontibacter ramchanderi TaxID=1179743 RepID=A0A2N3V340_9BACT|nr:hypothetical protein BD749_1000 [Pontibacter ramchanderi]